MTARVGGSTCGQEEEYKRWLVCVCVSFPTNIPQVQIASVSTSIPHFAISENAAATVLRTADWTSFLVSFVSFSSSPLNDITVTEHKLDLPRFFSLNSLSLCFTSTTCGFHRSTQETQLHHCLWVSSVCWWDVDLFLVTCPSWTGILQTFMEMATEFVFQALSGELSIL